MPDIPVITLSCSPGLRTNGDVVSGILNLNLRLANEKEVEAVRICLRGEINTHVTVTSTQSVGASNLTSIRYGMSPTDNLNPVTGLNQLSGPNHTRTTSKVLRERVRLFDQTVMLWTPRAPLPPGSSEIAGFPFTFVLPDRGLPPSFEGGNHAAGGSVKYYVQAVAERKSWYKINYRINQAFPFLPIDHSPAPYLILPNWPGEWQLFRESEKMRRGIISHHGLLQADFSMPTLPAIPLFQPIPVQLRIVCQSKPLSMSAENDLSKFDFPRNPKLTDCELVLRQSCRIMAHQHSRQCTDGLGLQGGFGKPDDQVTRGTWGDQVQVSLGSPHWVVDEEEKGKGRWREEIRFSSIIVFRCSPPFNTRNIETNVHLDLDVEFPGIGNKIKLTMGPLPLTSGMAPPHDNQNLHN